METINKPQITPLEMGETLKVLQIEGLAGMTMPPHSSSKEAVIVVQEGRAILKMPERDHLLKSGSTFVVPAGKEHKLSIEADFKAIAIMAVDSVINFI